MGTRLGKLRMQRRRRPNSKPPATVPQWFVPRWVVERQFVERWLRPLALALSAVCLFGWFSPEISDPDFWWHLKTGQYIVEKHALPVPDPFAYTTALAKPSYAAESR